MGVSAAGRTTLKVFSGDEERFENLQYKSVICSEENTLYIKFFTQNWCTLIFLVSSILLFTGGDQDTALKHVSAMDRVSRIMRFYDNSSWAWQEIFVKWVLHAWIYSVSVQAVMTILFCL